MIKLDLFFLFGFSGIMSITSSIMQPEFYLIKDALTWSAAQEYCRMRYTDLATVTDNHVLLKLTDMARDIKGSIWIGLYNDINSWRWSLNNLLLANQASINWQTGQPDNYKGSEACGGLGEGGYWRDYNCSILKPVLCFNAGVSRDVRVNIPLNWTEAQTYCRRYHTDLASSLNQKDITELNQKIANQGPSWFGLYRDTWKWLDGTVATNIQWSPGQPDNFNLQENCGMLEDRRLSDENCDYTHPFFCEYRPQQSTISNNNIINVIPPVIRQVIKLQVKSDGNVFDLAVQSSILELIKQKLKQHGMLKGITVTWRVQPHGNIFYKGKKVPEDKFCSVAHTEYSKKK